MTTTHVTPATIEDVKTLEVIRGRHERAVGLVDRLGLTGPLRAFAYGDAVTLIEIATRGLAARLQLDALAGLSIRVEAVRALHEPAKYGGLLLCAGCSTNCGNVLWPCPTMQVIDGLEAP